MLIARKDALYTHGFKHICQTEITKIIHFSFNNKLNMK